MFHLTVLSLLLLLSQKVQVQRPLILLLRIQFPEFLRNLFRPLSASAHPKFARWRMEETHTAA
jgi:hypothetical protein